MAVQLASAPHGAWKSSNTTGSPPRESFPFGGEPMAYVKSGRPAGRPKTYCSDAEKPRHLSIRLPAALYARLEATAAEQRSCITHVTGQALTRYLSHHQPPDLRATD